MGESDRPRMVGINHVALEVGDVEEAIAWYGALFELDIRGRSDSMAFLDLGDQFIALAETEEAEASEDDHRHVGLVVDDREAVRARLEEVGIELLETGGMDVRDPWGNRLQIVEYASVQFTKADHVLDGMQLGYLEKDVGAIEELAEKDMAPE